MTASPSRPTIRCLLEDLSARWPKDAVGACLRAGRLPGPDIRLGVLDHELVTQARIQFDPTNAYPTERVDELDDRVWLKIKSGSSRWRGAATVLDDLAWLGAAGWREEGSRDDFYAELGRTCRSAAKGSHAAAKADTTWLLPGAADRARIIAEQVHEAVFVTPVLELQRLLADAVREPDAWIAGTVAGGTVRVRIEQQTAGYIHLDTHPAHVAGLLHAIDTLLAPLTDADQWDIDDRASSNDRIAYFGALGGHTVSRALAWTP